MCQDTGKENRFLAEQDTALIEAHIRYCSGHASKKQAH